MPARLPLHRRRTVLGIAAATTLSLAGAAIVDFRADADLASMRATTRDLQHEWDARPFTRQPLWGDAHAERAFDHYDDALARATDLIQQDKALRDLWKYRLEPSTAASDALRAQWQPLVATMRRGAHATDIRAVPTGVPQTHVTNLLTARGLTNVTVESACRALDAGNAREAVELTLDAMTFGHDLLRRGSLIDQMVGGAMLAIASAEAWPDAQLARLDADSLRLLGEGLTHLDHMLDPAIDGIGELVTTVHAMGDTLHSDHYAPSWDAWAFGFSNRWMLADAFVRTTDFVRTLERERRRPWPQRQALIQVELAELVRRGDNRMLAMMVPNYDSAERSRRDVVALVRLLRMAVAVHQGASLTPLPDPLGDGAIAVRSDDTGTVLRCTGSDERKHLARHVAQRR